MKKYLGLMVLLAAGCTSTLTENIKTVSDQYENINFDDGISLEESKIIAQKQLIKKNVVDLYNLSEPRLEKDVSDLPHHQDYWFVFFEEKQPSSIPYIFMVLVDKQTGKIKFADDHAEGNQWILEAALLH